MNINEARRVYKRTDLGVEDCIFRTGATVFRLKENPEDTPPPVARELEGNEKGMGDETDSKRRPCWALMGGFDSGGMSASVTS